MALIKNLKDILLVLINELALIKHWFGNRG